MTQTHCNECQAPLTAEAIRAGACPKCGQVVDEAAQTLATGAVDRTVEATSRAPAASRATPGAGDPGRAALIGKEIGGCRVNELVGYGAMGAVYAATQLQLDRKVAFKVIHPELWQNERVLKRFQQEARAVGKLSSPYVVQIHQVGFEEGINYLVMEFVSGGNLRTYAARQPGNRISSEEAVKFLEQCCAGLKEAEAQGILHRDIKPDNLLLDRNGDVKIADFGLAKTLGDRLDLTASSDLMGTPLYMSPEQCRGEALDFRSDMYSLGASFYYLLTAQPPVEGKTIFEVLQTKTKLQCLSPAAALPELSGAGPISRVIEKMTALNADDRYESYDALLRDLERVGRGEAVTGVRRASRASAERSRAGVAVGAVVFLAAVGAGVFWVDPFGWRAVAPPPPPPPVVDPQPDPEKEREEARRREEEERQKQAAAATQAEAARRERERRAQEARARRDVWQLEYDKMTADLAQHGPTDATRTLARRLLAEMPEDSDSGLQAEVRKLVDDVAAGYEITQTLRDVVPPKTIQLPFLDVEQHVTRVQAVLKADGAGPELAKWLEQWRSERLADPALRDAARRVLLAHWDKVKSTDLRGVTTDLQQRDFERDLKLLDESKARLCQVFPEFTADVDTAVPAAEAAARADELASRRQELALLADLAAAQVRVDGVQSLAAWASIGRDISPALSALRTRRDELVTRYPAAADGLGKAIDKLKRDADGLFRIANGLQLGLAAFARHELGAARAQLAKLEDLPAELPEQGQLRVAIDGVDQAVKLLRDKGDWREPDVMFQRVREGLLKLGPDANGAVAWIDAWRDRLATLRKVVETDMIAIPGEKVELADGSEVAVESFFIDRFEASRADFRRFLREVEKPDSEAAKAFASAAERERVLELLAEVAQPNNRDSFPMDKISHRDAAAYLRWRQKSLPRLKEWWLVAKGPTGKTTTFPWGEGWSNRPADRNATSFYVNVDAGGRSARFPESPVHHLAGNVAEWLEADSQEGKTRGQLVGGSFRDEEQVLYTGKRVTNLPFDERAEGCGCRGVLRVGEFVSDLLPR